jgi:hypothetical protein
MSKDNRYCTITTDNITKRCYLLIPPEYYEYKNWEITVQQINDFRCNVMLHNTHKEVLFENNKWSSEEYKTQYSLKCAQEFPHVDKIIKIIKNTQAYKK